MIKIQHAYDRRTTNNVFTHEFHFFYQERLLLGLIRKDKRTNLAVFFFFMTNAGCSKRLYYILSKR